MRVVGAVLQVCLIYCIAHPFVNGKETNATKTLEHDESDEQEEQEENDNKVNSTLAVDGNPSNSANKASSQEIRSHLLPEIEMKNDANHANKVSGRRLQQILTRMLPAGEVQMLKLINGLLQELVVEQKEICNAVARGDISSTPFFDCSIFGLQPKRQLPARNRMPMILKPRTEAIGAKLPAVINRELVDNQVPESKVVEEDLPADDD